MTLKKNLLAGLSALALGFSASLGTAVAQEPAPAPMPEMEAPAAAAPVDEGKLQSFAVAFLQVTRVTQEYQPQIEQAASPEDQQRLQEEAGQQMVQVVESAEGISVDEYNMIIQAAQTDPDLAQRINGHITEAAGASPEAAPTEPAPAPQQ